MASVSWSPLVMAAIVGGVIGAAIAWVVARGRGASEAARAAAEIARLTAVQEAERRHAQEREALVRQSEAQLKDVFRSLSSDALRENAEAFLQVARGALDEARTASWWNAGPMPGGDAGKALLSIHTYRTGKALGNELFADGRPQLAEGDLIKLYGDDGQVQCYEFTGATKVWVADYDPESDVMIDYEGDPQLAIIICWDFNRSTETWDSRVFFYATPVTAAA